MNGLEATNLSNSLGRSAPSSSATVFVSYDGCDQGMVGCSSGTTQSDSFGVVVSSGVTSTYQQSRNANGLSSCISFPVTSSRLLCMVSTDNTSVVTYIQAQGGTHSHSLYLETKWFPNLSNTCGHEDDDRLLCPVLASNSRWAYSSLSTRDLSLLKIRPHELRALSASWAYINNVPLSEVLQAAF
ncbi:hypothetical protein DPMN_083128, partial [Dreissena polymorpha]